MTTFHAYQEYKMSCASFQLTEIFRSRQREKKETVNRKINDRCSFTDSQFEKNRPLDVNILNVA